MNLVIVESPSKAKTIEKYLGKGYKVMSTVGHIIDLPKSNLAVDVDKDYEPSFVTIRGKASVIKKLKKAVPEKGDVYLAMDPDREGEAIAWHTANALKLKKPKRIVFHEVTKSAVNEAIKHPRAINQDLVDAQVARRVLDRLVGYKVSEVLWKKIWYGLSAGRVQSVALRLIVEKEREILAFVPEEFWKVVAQLKSGDPKLQAKLARKNGKKFLPTKKKEVETLDKDIKGGEFNVKSVKTKKLSKRAYAPFTTSTMQQGANNVLGFTAKRAMGVAQALYQAGYITYMRTDSVNLSGEAVSNMRKYIEEEFGKKYVPAKPNVYKNKSRNAQEAHEAIRPTDLKVTYATVKAKLGEPEAKLYRLIYNRAVGSQMSNQEVESLNIVLEIEGKSGDKYEFTMGVQKVLFEGFRKLLKTSSKKDSEAQTIEHIKEGEKFKLDKLIKDQQFTKPPARYNDASLVKALEEHGVGRPSTYASIISTVENRGYVVKDGRSLVPTDVGMVVSDFLMAHFDRLVDYEYTADVEEKLDDIAEGSQEYAPFIDREYKPLLKEIDNALEHVKKEDVVILEDSDEKCPKCKSGMVVRLGRYGKFLSCDTFPDCNGMKSLDGGADSLDYEKFRKVEECDKCDGHMMLKHGKYGKFWACENYPDCKHTVPMLLQELCPECNNPLVERSGKWGKMFTGCSNYPDCKHIKKTPKKKKEE